MRRKIWTKQESFTGVGMELLFVLIWYGAIGRSLASSPGQLGLLAIFLVAGLLPLVNACSRIRRACYYRRLHRQYMQRPPKRGRIVSCERRDSLVRGSKGRYHTQHEYILVVELLNDGAFEPVQVRSEPYTWPVYRVLGSPEVDVYTDETGWHYILDGFRYKEHRSDPGILRESSYDRVPGEGGGYLLRIIAAAVMIFMLLQILRM